jgi:hypothetical protein
MNQLVVAAGVTVYKLQAAAYVLFKAAFIQIRGPT